MKEATKNPESSQQANSCFDAMETLQTKTDDSGWKINYRQLQAGVLQATSEARYMNDFRVSREQANLGIEVTGQCPDHSFIFLFSFSKTGTRINHQDCYGRQGDMVILGPGAEFYFSTFSEHEMYSLQVPCSWFDSAVVPITPDWWERTPGLALKVQSDYEKLVYLSQQMLILLREEADESIDNVAFHNLTDCLFDMLTDEKYQCLSLKRKKRVLKSAHEFIENHLRDDFSVVDLCDYTGTSLRTMERAFKNEYQVGPKKYIQIRRLNEIREKLAKRTSFDKYDRISDLAVEYGFRHLGRFSSSYRNLFGTLPSVDFKTSVN